MATAQELTLHSIEGQSEVDFQKNQTESQTEQRDQAQIGEADLSETLAGEADLSKTQAKQTAPTESQVGQPGTSESQAEPQTGQIELQTRQGEESSKCKCCHICQGESKCKYK